MKAFLPAGIALALATSACAQAQVPMDPAALRREISELRADYEARLNALEQRLEAVEAQRASAAAATEPPSRPPSQPVPAVAATPPPATPPEAGRASAFNPGISLILSGRYARTSRDPDSHAITGFRVPEDIRTGPGERGFSLGESELVLAASVDPWHRAQASIALADDGSAEVEEAYVQTTALGQGFSLRGGRFLSSVGYLNSKHAHTWDFVDAPLAYQAMLGTAFHQDGVQLAWLAPTGFFLEVAAELGRGDGSRKGTGAAALAVHAGGDVGASHSWRAGLSMLETRHDALDLVSPGRDGTTATGAYRGRIRTWIADATWKWAPDGNPARTSLVVQGEYLRSVPRGTLETDDGNGVYRGGAQSGWYLQGAWQFMPRWRTGIRTERLGPAGDAGVPPWPALDASGARPRRDTVMLDFSPSEFSRWRLQFAHDRSRAGAPDRQVFIQYQVSLGAHGAHRY